MPLTSRRLALVLRFWALAWAASSAAAASCADSNRPSGIDVRRPQRPAADPAYGQIGPDGGTLSRLLIACVGDTRPPVENDTADYPIDIITQLYADIEAMTPRPPLVIATGDYLFASSRQPEAASAQLDLYARARATYSGLVFPAMGNHECTGATSSNCGPESFGGWTPNYVAFLNHMLEPIGKSDPYYMVRIDAIDGGWSAKLVFVAANAWSSVQEAWLESMLSLSTTYTFIIRHEPAIASAAPGVAPSEAIMARHPYTLAIVGHEHTYAHYADNPREIIIGNGGAPLSSKDYGFGVLSQRADGAIDVDMKNYMTGASDPGFHFTVHPDGSAL